MVILIEDNVLNKNIYTVNWSLFGLLHSQWPFPMQKYFSQSSSVQDLQVNIRSKLTHFMLPDNSGQITKVENNSVLPKILHSGKS
jgi:hypothetical protein